MISSLVPSLIFVYLFTSFIRATLNIREWSDEDRIGTLVAALLIAFVTITLRFEPDGVTLW